MVKILYNGIERADFIYYLAKILSARVDTVLVNDVSDSHDLYDSVSGHSEEDEYVWRNITYVKDMDLARSTVSNVSVYVEYRGMNLDIQSVLGEDDEEIFHLIMPDCTYEGMEMVKNLRKEGTRIYILRDVCSKKITDKSFALMNGLTSIAGHICLSGLDMAAYVAFTHNGKQKFGGCSDDMQLGLSYVASEILNIDKPKMATRLLKKADRLK